jgi:DNA-binding ferritin-like protein
LLKVQKAPAATPKRRRMANVLDAVLETVEALSPGPIKKIAEAAKVQAKAEAEPAAPIETKVVVPEDKTDQKALVAGMKEGQEATERAKSPAPEAIVEDADYIYRHASVKKLSEEEVLEARHYARKIEISEGSFSV